MVAAVLQIVCFFCIWVFLKLCILHSCEAPTGQVPQLPCSSMVLSKITLLEFLIVWTSTLSSFFSLVGSVLSTVLRPVFSHLHCQRELVVSCFFLTFEPDLPLFCHLHWLCAFSCFLFVVADLPMFTGDRRHRWSCPVVLLLKQLSTVNTLITV